VIAFGLRQTAAVLVLAGAAGCHSGKTFNGPTVDAFTGRIVAGGKPVSFPPGEQVILRVYHHETGKSWGVPIQSDGTFKVGWMPIGTFTAVLERPAKSHRSGPNRYTVPNSFSIVDGQTEYTVDLGSGFKP
jgi:hypothetical protein